MFSKITTTEYDVAFVYYLERGIFKSYERLITVNGAPIENDHEQKATLKKLSHGAPSIWYYTDFFKNVPECIHFVTSRYKKQQERENRDSLENTNSTYREAVLTSDNTMWQKVLDDIWSYSQAQSYDTGAFQRDVVDYLDRNPEGKLRYTNYLAAIGAALNSVIIENWAKISNQDRIQHIQLETTDALNFSHYRSYSFRITEKDETRYTIAERSLGFRWFFSFMLYTEFRKLRKENSVFLLDEPASNLHASSQEQILKAIHALAEKAGVIYSTHSPYLLDISNFENMYVVKNKKHQKESKIECLPLARNGGRKIENEYVRPLIHHLCFKVPEILTTYNSDIQTIEATRGDSKEKGEKILALIATKLGVSPSVASEALSYIQGAYTSHGLTKNIEHLLAAFPSIVAP